MPDDKENESHSVTEALTRFSLDRRVTVLVLFLSLVVVGLVATLGIPLDTFPKGYDFPALNVQVPWPNAPAEEVLDKITLPLEEELSTVRNLDGINSWSSSGGANVFLRFKQGTDMDVAYRETRDRLERARVLFPEDVERTFIHKHDLAAIPLMAVGVVVDPGLREYYNLIQQEVVLPLSRIDGVATVDSEGLREKEILIEVDKSRSDAHGLNIYELGQELAGDNFTMASGNVRDGGRKFLLRSVAAYSSIEQLENRPLTPEVRLKDVAEIKYEPPDREHVVRVNSRPAFALLVKKEGEANTVEVSRRVRAEIERMADNPRLALVDLQPFWDQGRVIEDALGNLVKSGRLGGVLAALVLFLFLRQFRLTAIIALAIPFSLLIALVVMYFAGETLNILTILGLVICVGLLVDNSVVVAENILRHYRDGETRRNACIRGAGEIALAITLATLTTVAVFLPVSLVEGEGKFFLVRLAIPISVSLIASLFVALVFIPLSVHLTFRSRPTGGTGEDSAAPARRGIREPFDRALRGFYTATFGRLNRAYNRALNFFLHHRLELVLLLAAVFVATVFFAVKKVEFAQTQKEDQLSFNIRVNLSAEYNFADASEYFRRLEDAVEARRETYGIQGYFISHGSRGGRLEAWFDKDAPREVTAREIGSKLFKELPRQPGVKLYYSAEDQTREAAGEDLYLVRLEGDDAALLEQVAEQLEPILLSVGGVLGRRAGNEIPPSELALVIDRERATASEVNPNVIAGVVGYALRGQPLPRYNEAGRQIPVRVRFREEDRESLDELKDFQVPTQSGGLLPLSALTEARFLGSPRGISRNNRRVSHSFTLELEKEKAGEARTRLDALQELIELPEGVRFGAIQSNINLNEDLMNMQFAGVLSVVFIYLLMGFLFESFVLPLSIILTIPLAGIGVAWIHYWTGKSMDMLGVVGVILLIGVVVNNGIVLLDYVTRLRARGFERTQALLFAADRRFRPIIMTASTTIIGMLPLTVSRPSELGMSYKSFGLTLIGGMTTATLLTLLVVPVMYTFFDDARVAVSAALRRGVRRRVDSSKPA